MSATVKRTRAPMMLLSAGAVVSGIGLGCSSSTKWPSGSVTMTPRARLPGPKASGSPPGVTTGTPARLSGANAALMSRTIRIKVVPPGSCGRGRTGFPVEPFDLDHLHADGGAGNPRGDEAQLRPGHAEHLEQRRIGVVGTRSGRLRWRNGEAEQVAVELDRLVEIGDDRAVVPRADDDVTRRRRGRRRRRLRHEHPYPPAEPERPRPHQPRRVSSATCVLPFHGRRDETHCLWPRSTKTRRRILVFFWVSWLHFVRPLRPRPSASSRGAPRS